MGTSTISPDTTPDFSAPEEEPRDEVWLEPPLNLARNALRGMVDAPEPSPTYERIKAEREAMKAIIQSPAARELRVQKMMAKLGGPGRPG